MNQSDIIFVFTDAATSPQAGVAIGIFVCLKKQDIDELNELENKVSYRQYQSNKSTWSEIKTVIHALNSIQIKSEQLQQIEIYTDCQNLCDLLGKRKEKLEKNNFITQSGAVHSHAELYKELYAITNKFQVKVFKVKGHHEKSQHVSWQQKIFSILDKLCRKKLRSILNENTGY